MLVDTDVIRQQRQQRGWTQEHVATLCNLSVRTIQRSEKTGVTSMETTQALAAAFEVDYVTLLASGGVKTAHSGVTLTQLYLVVAGALATGIVIGALFF